MTVAKMEKKLTYIRDLQELMATRFTEVKQTSAAEMERANEMISHDLALINSEVLRLASHSDRLHHLTRMAKKATDLSTLTVFTESIPNTVSNIYEAMTRVEGNATKIKTGLDATNEVYNQVQELTVRIIVHMVDTYATGNRHFLW